MVRLDALPTQVLRKAAVAVNGVDNLRARALDIFN
jgi:hypothetical protein